MDGQEDKKCLVCNKEMALALVGVGIGVLFILMSLDTIRRMRLSTVDSEVVVEDD